MFNLCSNGVCSVLLILITLYIVTKEFKKYIVKKKIEKKEKIDKFMRDNPDGYRIKTNYDGFNIFNDSLLIDYYKNGKIKSRSIKNINMTLECLSGHYIINDNLFIRTRYSGMLYYYGEAPPIEYNHYLVTNNKIIFIKKNTEKTV